MSAPQRLICGAFSLELNVPKVMAIINLTPDSFSGDGLHHARDGALRAAERAVADGAAILDIGGESSRPGAAPVSVQEELDRVMPVLESLRGIGVPVSVDTLKPDVMQAALQSGVAMINDINALRAEGAVSVAAGSQAAVCLMHMQGEPRRMQAAPHYDDVVTEVETFLRARAQSMLAAGCGAERIVLDPGFGFGKSLAHNTLLFRAIPRLASLGYPVLVGISRKSMLGQITGRPVEQRLSASVSAALMAAQHGASILRVHDVAETVDALRVWAALRHA